MAFNISSIISPLSALNQPQERLYWNYLLMAYLIGAIVVWVRHRKILSLRDTLAALFPKKIWWQRSVLHDLGFSYLMLILQFSCMGFIAALIGNQMAQLFADAEHRFSGGIIATSQNSGVVTLVTTLILTLAGDFALYLAHWLLHRIPCLWPFHAMHHSAETMTPFTGYRQHPVDTVINAVVSGVVVGLVFGLLRLLFGPETHFLGVGGQTVLLLLFYLFGYHLRHTHIWVDYGPSISRFFISPAQHQIHHSLDPRHYGKNLGYMLAIWDGFFGTLYVPRKHEDLAFGLAESFFGPRPGFVALLWKPFAELIRHHQPALVALSLVGILVWPKLDPFIVKEQDRPKITFKLSELTSPEVGQLIREGYTTVIVPTGGTEQNGPHLVLGKHNAIIERNATEIASRLGHTLVAPVMAYVPEGDIDSREGHMAYPGTLSIRSTTFQSLLSDTAGSLKVHGFKRIVFMGDSGGNQNDQEDVASYLSATWKSEGIEVISLSDYYRKNHQADYLAFLGFTTDAIGHHAGIRDTSELLYVEPEGVRTSQLADRSHQKDLQPSGSDGNTLLASPELGKSLTRLKVDAALKALSTTNQPMPKEHHASGSPSTAPAQALFQRRIPGHLEDSE